MPAYNVRAAEKVADKPDKGAAWIERFWRRVNKIDSCWIWTGYRNRNGYGVAYRTTTPTEVHRLSYELRNGPIPQGLQIDHLCRNRACVRPDHLEAVTQRENLRRGAGTKLTREQVAWIRATSRSALEISRELGIDRSHIYKIRRGEKWKGC